MYPEKDILEYISCHIPDTLDTIRNRLIYDAVRDLQIKHTLEK